MITVNSFFSGTLNTVDAVVSNFVNTAYLHFVQANVGVITLVFTLYVMLLGVQLLNHQHHLSLGAMTRHIIIMTCVYGLIMNWSLYNLFVYRIFTIEPNNIAKIIVNSAGQFATNESIELALDGIYSAVIKAAMDFFGQVNFSAGGITFLCYAILVFIIGNLMCVFALLLFIYAKMMMAVSLALGPIFLLFILWEPTKGMFSAWLNKLITIALIPIVTSAILVLMLSVINITLDGINLPFESLQFKGIAPFLGLCLATTLILAQVFRICSALGGGITLSSLFHGGQIAKSALQHSGVAAAGRATFNWSKDKVQQVKRRMMKGGK